MAPVDPLELVGTTIAAKYTIERLVGEGGYAIVYRATHLIWKRPVAIKVFKGLANFSASERARLLEGFIQEGALLADLSERSAAICQARDVGSLTTKTGLSVPYMVLEWLEGQTIDIVLADERARGLPPRSLEGAVMLLEPIAEALALAHRKGIAHRDIKPGNIFIIGDARSDAFAVKLLDFGIAKVVQDAQKMAGAFDKTSGAVTSFTPSYGSPEQFSRAHGPTGPWTDVFALALIMGEALTGKDPLPGDTLAQMGYASTDKQVRPTPRTLGADVSDEVEAVFRKALAVSPQERYQTVGEFWNELRGSMYLEPLRGINSSAGLRMPSSSQTSAPILLQNVPGHGSSVHPPTTAEVLSLDPGQVPTNPSQTNPMGSLAPQGSTPPHRRSAPLALMLGGAGLVFVVGMVGVVGALKGRAKKPEAVASVAPPSAQVAPKPEPTCPKNTIKIMPGNFFMGSDDKDDFEFERPAHKVTLSKPFCMDVFEVTTEDYKSSSDSGDVKRAGQTNDWDGITSVDRKAYDPLCNIRAPEDRGRHPINCVTWEMADAYCKAKKMRLPTEAEWEYSARGPDGRKYPWGDELPSANFLNACGRECLAWGKKNHVDPTTGMGAMYADDDGFAATAPVGSFPAGKSRYGIQDVVGNVWEWVADYHAPYTADEQIDPKGPEVGEERVIRGGAWNGAMASWVRPTFRYHDTPTKRSHGIGFRCAMTLNP